MKSVFILEDNEHKLQDIIDVLKNEFRDDIIIKSGAYFNESMCRMDDEDFDYAILDNNILRYPDSAELVTDAAEEAMAWFELRGINTKCIACSSDNVQLEKYYNNCLGTIKYSSISLDWSKQLINYLKLIY